jgi:hypothetical protein
MTRSSKKKRKKKKELKPWNTFYKPGITRIQLPKKYEDDLFAVLRACSTVKRNYNNPFKHVQYQLHHIHHFQEALIHQVQSQFLLGPKDYVDLSSFYVVVRLPAGVGNTGITSISSNHQEYTILELLLLFSKLSPLLLAAMQFYFKLSLNPLKDSFKNEYKMKLLINENSVSIEPIEELINDLSSCGSIYSSCTEHNHLKSCICHSIEYCSRICQKYPGKNINTILVLVNENSH